MSAGRSVLHWRVGRHSGLSREFAKIMTAAGIGREAGETKQALNRTFFKKSFLQPGKPVHSPGGDESNE